MKAQQFNRAIICSEDGMTYSQWIIGNESYQFAPITHLCTNPFEELLVACEDLLMGRSGLIYWFHEPRITKITLSILPDKEHLLISIHPISQLQAENITQYNAGPFIFKTTVAQFLLAIFYELQKRLYLQDSNLQRSGHLPFFPRILFNTFKAHMKKRFNAMQFKNTLSYIH